MFTVSNRNTKASCNIYSKLAIETPKRSQYCRSGVFISAFIVNLEQVNVDYSESENYELA